MSSRRKIKSNNSISSQFCNFSIIFSISVFFDIIKPLFFGKFYFILQ
nr:MAG TPA: hypothetical protein [Caudoviricetes sp.]